MKIVLIFVLMTVCILGMSSCGSKDAMPKTSDSVSNPVQNAETSKLNEEKNWSEQDIASMFSHAQETDWECTPCPPAASAPADRLAPLCRFGQGRKCSCFPR